MFFRNSYINLTLQVLVRKANQEGRGGWIDYLENLETFLLNLENQKCLVLAI